MLISEVIKVLNDIKEGHGDIRVTKYNTLGGDVPNIIYPSVRFTKKMEKRERIKKYWTTLDDEDLKDEKVVIV
jgi:hypothetical protein